MPVHRRRVHPTGRVEKIAGQKPNPVAYDGFEPSGVMIHRPRGDEVLEREQIDKIGRDV